MRRFAAQWICIALLSASVTALADTSRPAPDSVPGLAKHQADPVREFSARVIVVLDGDTVLIRRPGGLVKIRLAGIDAPEKDQAFGAASRNSLSDMVMGRRVKIASQAVDQYGRMVAKLSVDGLDVNAEQVRLGMAWAAVGWRQSRRAPAGVPFAGEYSSHHDNRALIVLQDEARHAARGLWAQNDPVPPWRWRKLHPATQPGAVVVSASPAATLEAGTGCGKKRRCSEMISCEEAKHYFLECGVRSLDGNGDGMPCERLCAPREKIKN